MTSKLLFLPYKGNKIPTQINNVDVSDHCLSILKYDWSVGLWVATTVIVSFIGRK